MTERELFVTYNKELYRTCYYMLRNKQDAEDVCHDVFITVYRQDWRSVEHVRAWLIRITMNHCLNYLKKNRASKDQEKRYYNHKLELTSESVDSIVQSKASADELTLMIHRLPDKIRAAIALRYVSDLSLAETAEILRVPLGTAKSRVHKGLKLMKSMLKNSESLLKGGEAYEGYGTSAVPTSK